MNLDVKTLYRTYEKNYIEVNKQVTDNDVAFKVLNDALIYSCLQTAFKQVDVGFSLDKFKENISKYEKEMGTPIFFLKYKSKVVDEYTLLKIINNFNMILGVEKSFTISAVEEVLGNVLEQHINRKATGSYYTPLDTTSYITRNAILVSIYKKLPCEIKNVINFSIKGIIENPDIFLNNISSLDETKRKDIVKIVDGLKVIDPTCGSGAFIITAYNYLMTIKEKLGEDIGSRETITNTFNTLHGLDNSSEAIVLTKMRLILKILSNGFMINDFDKIFEHNFKIADAFTGKDPFIKENTYGKNDFNWNSFGYLFDVIIGNPPYIETANKIITNEQFRTNKCGNLYAQTIERSCNISSNESVISFIVPLSFIATPRMKIARECLQEISSEIFYASFADRPGCIFKGVHQRLTIFTANINHSTKSSTSYTSKYHFWYNEERHKLFKNITYIENNDNSMPKIGEEIEKSILEKIEKKGRTISDLINRNGQYPLYLSTRIGFWTKCFIDKPTSSEFKEIRCNNEIDQHIINAFLNSTTFYYYWVMKSDCWHVSEKDYRKIYFNIKVFEKDTIDKIVDLSKQLIRDLEKNKVYIGSKQVDYEYKHKLSKTIIDEIDKEFAKLFGFSKDELDFIISYTVKYRMNNAGDKNDESN